MVRKGTITSIKSNLAGIITDENEQEIPFLMEESHQQITVGTLVEFRIETGIYGLMAVSVRPIDQE